MATGYITVPRLRKSGNYKSELIQGDEFKSKQNPNGLFKLVIWPKDFYEGPTILYTKTSDGYIVDGECAIICGDSEIEIDEKARYYMNQRHGNVIHKEVKRIV